MNLSEKNQNAWFVTPAGAALALLCFFMPWVKFSCMGTSQTASGFRLAQDGNLVTVALIAALAILGISLFLWQKQTPWKSKVPVLIASGIGLGGILIELIHTSTGIKTEFGRVSMEELGLTFQFGAFGTIIGFIIAIGGVFLNHLPLWGDFWPPAAWERPPQVPTPKPLTAQVTPPSVAPRATSPPEATTPPPTTTQRTLPRQVRLADSRNGAASQTAGRVPTTPYLEGLRASLTVTEGPADVNEVYSITKKESIIGRKGDIQLSAAHLMVSGEHARITYLGEGQFTLTHLSRTNPTQVNGQDVTESRSIRSGDDIQLGGTKLRFEVTHVTPPRVVSQTAGRVPTIPYLDGVQASLRVIEGPADVNEIYPITKKESIMGRNGDIQLSAAHLTISGEHARLTYLGSGQFTITHLSRTNLTRVNGQDVTESRPLESGDDIQLGGTKLHFEVKS